MVDGVVAVGNHNVTEVGDGRWETKMFGGGSVCAPRYVFDSFEEAASYAAQQPNESSSGTDLDTGYRVMTHPTHPNYLRTFHVLMARHRERQRRLRAE